MCCSPNQSSPPGATSADYCTCTAGYGQDALGDCTLCELGSYWQGAFMANQVEEAVAKLQATRPCLACSTLNPDGGWITLTEGATSSNQCVCAPG